MIYLIANSKKLSNVLYYVHCVLHIIDLSMLFLYFCRTWVARKPVRSTTGTEDHNPAPWWRPEVNVH